MSPGTTQQLRFEIEWEPADRVAGSELAATWARLEVWADGECVTQVEDIETRSARRSIYVPLYPFAEWIAYNWWLLRANVRPAAFPAAAFRRPGSSAIQPWFRAHNVRAAGDGYVWPNLTVLPEGPVTRLVWHADRQPLPGAPIRYLGTGESVIDSSETERAFADVVEAVLTRLDEEAVQDVPLRDEWQSVSTTDPEEAQFCLAAARLGLDPYALDEPTEAALLTAGDALDDVLLREFLEAVTPTAIADGLTWLARSSEAIDGDPAAPSDALEVLRSEFTAATGSALELPWSRGWRQATAARTLLGLDDTTQLDMSETFRVKSRTSGDAHLQALGGLSTAGGGVLVLGRVLRTPDVRFAQARALWHVIAPEPPARFLLTSSPAYEPRVERAFAAELLAPANGVREVLGATPGDVVTVQDIDAAGKHFAVNPFVVRHQVENQLDVAIVA